MKKSTKISIRNLEIEDLQKVLGGKAPIVDGKCPAVDVISDSDGYQCGEGTGSVE